MTGLAARGPRLRMVRRALAMVLVAVAVLTAGMAARPAAAQGAGASTPAPVWVTRVTGAIDPPLAGYLEKTMQAAAQDGAGLLVVEIDTPGGLDSAMRQIIQAEIASPVAVAFYVWPQGARSASAGVYIMMGADLAAMAPQTNLGSAHPVSLTGAMDEEMKQKVTNDAAAYIKGLAVNHGRNAVWAEQAVRESVNLTAEEALGMNVIDIVAVDLDDLLRQADGRATTPKGVTLHTAGAPIHRVEMGWSVRLFHIVVDPNISFILLILGVLGLAVELAAPGIGVAGILGGISLLLSLYGLQVLPVSWVGLGLIALGMVFFVAEAHVHTLGALALGGLISLALGGLLIFNADQSALRVDWGVVVLVAVVAAGSFVFVIRAIARSRRAAPVTGVSGLVGSVGVVRAKLEPEGLVFATGELWKAVVENGSVEEGEEVEVIGVDGLTLRVRHRGRVNSESPADGAAGPGGAKEE
jgi:membrane-bound serine protease (ClpP class)